MKQPSEEALYAQMMRGTQAAGASALITPMLEARRKTLIENTIAKYRSIDPERKLSERDAFVFVASLAATYDLEDDMKRVIADGERAGQHFVK